MLEFTVVLILWVISQGECLSFRALVPDFTLLKFSALGEAGDLGCGGVRELCSRCLFQAR